MVSVLPEVPLTVEETVRRLEELFSQVWGVPEDNSGNAQDISARAALRQYRCRYWRRSGSNCPRRRC